ncbi:hypothetical protein COV12_03635 [Candidatus Woesearchaeota archaeon CG10_big_fil_rev_8_21_14_0_10_32_24]|nr:MAG: hypothetical protein COV12_03635 [Candidatus Woesearchaeota archaeon CG10_big_fil_rev_8_21_14_0_10_32_24]
MNYLKNVRGALQTVYSSKKYYLISFIAGIIIFSLNSMIRNYKLLLNQFSFNLLYNLILGTFTSFATSMWISLIIIAILTGMIVAFTIFLISRQINSSGVPMSISSILIAIVAPACPSCAVSLFGVVGLGSLIAYLPFKGEELGPLAILLLAISLGYLSKKVVTTTCEIKNKKIKKD